MSVLAKEELRCWLGLWRAPGIGPTTFFKLLSHFPVLQALFPLHQKALRIHGYDQKLITALQQIDWAAVDKDLAWSEQVNCNVITINDPHYPYLLKQIPDAPPLLFVQGDPAVLNTLQLAMVGSRNASSIGIDIAQQFSAYLAGSGITITSGLALGIDAACHRGALSQPIGKTIAVMGTGPDSIYPAHHQALAQQIIAQGALVTEFPTESRAKANHFPRRNRIISGLSAGVLVVEAAVQSGSLITARMAAEQGREVFAIPGSIHNPMAKGCHSLIKQGAKLVETAADIIEEISGLRQLIAKPLPCSTNVISDNLSPELAQLISHIEYAPTPIDVIVERSGLTVEDVSSMLLLLELANKIAVVPGGYMRT